MTNNTSLENKVFVVTAGAGGIGSTTVKTAASLGAKIAIANLELPVAETLAHEICQTGGEAIAVGLDLSQEQQIQDCVKTIVDHFGKIDVVNNNAALISSEIAMLDRDVQTMQTEVWDKTFHVNVRGTMLMSRECLPHLVASKGNIVNTASNLGLQGSVVQVAYGSSKAAIIQMTKSIAASHGRKGVRCNAVAPGMTMTDGLKSAFPDHLRKMTEDETLRDQLGVPQDISDAIVWLASDAAKHITGQCLVVDGGLASHVPGYMNYYNAVYGDDV
jgi:NAD(P)-dependent dehydrogenase (short-subunit alcohol dehydrogenase family)